MIGVERTNKIHSPLETWPNHNLSSKKCRPGLSSFTSDIYTIPIMKIGIEITTAVVRRRSNFVCSFRYISRAMSSDEGGRTTATETGGDADVEIVDNIVRIVNSGADG
jgi:hypothetical protein